MCETASCSLCSRGEEVIIQIPPWPSNWGWERCCSTSAPLSQHLKNAFSKTACNSTIWLLKPLEIDQLGVPVCWQSHTLEHKTACTQNTYTECVCVCTHTQHTQAQDRCIFFSQDLHTLCSQAFLKFENTSKSGEKASLSSAVGNENAGAFF